MEATSAVINPKNDRIDYLDVAKGIGIFLVVWAHAGGVFSKYIYQFHMPLFFLISGYLYHSNSSVKEFTIRKVKSIYIPFAFWNCMGLTFRYLIGIANFSIKSYILTILTLSKDGTFFGATWFLGALFVISVLYRILDEILKSYSHRHLMLLFFFVSLGICGYEITLPYMLSRTLILGMFYAFAVCYKDSIKKLDLSRGGKIFLAVILAGVFIVFGHYNSANMGGNSYGYFYAFIVEALAASYVTIMISSFINDHIPILSRLLKWLGKNSLYIVLWQFVMFRIVIAIQMILAGEELSNILNYYPIYSSDGFWPVVYTAVGLFLSVWIGRILTIRFWKNLIRKIKKSSQ